MSEKHYRDFFNFAIQHGCIIKQGGKHTKIFSAKGKLLQIVSPNRNNNRFGDESTARRILLRKIEAEK